MPIKTLIVDDEETLLEQAEVFLKERDEQIQVQTVSSAEKALKILEEEEFDVIVSDYQMPDTDGLELLKEIKSEKDFDIPFIMFTGKGREDVAVKALNLGADRYVQKGGDPEIQYDILMEAIKQAYEHSKAEEKVVELNSLLRSIRNVNQLIVQEDNLESLMKKSAEILLETRGYMNISIALLEDRGKIKPFVQSGFHEKRDWEIAPDEKGDAPKCFLDVVNSKSMVHVKESHEYCPDCHHFEEDIAHQTLLVPLLLEDELIGILSICHKQERTFSEEEKDLLQEVADDLSLAYDKLITETKLKESRERFETLSDSVPGIIYLCKNDERWTMLFINEAVKDITGYSKGKFLQDEISFTELYHPEDQEDIFRKVEEAVESNSSFHLVYRINNAEGDTLWLEEFGKAIYEDGNARYLVGSVHDITERKNVREKLKKSTKRYETLFEENPEAVVEVDEDFKVLRANTKFENLFDFDEEEVVGRHINDIVVPEEKLGEAKKLDEKTRKEGYFDHETIRIDKHGNKISVSITGRPVELEEETHYLAVYRDISERKTAEEKLKEREKKYRAIFENANDAILIMKKDGFVDCNEKTLKMFECSRDDIVGEPPYEFSPEKQPDGRKSRDKAMEKIDSALKGEPQEFEWIHTTKDGEPFHTHITLNRYKIEDEKFVMSIVRDITDRKRAEQHIEENKNKIERLHKISAELQTYQSEERVYSFAVEAAEYILDFDICGFDAVEGNKFVVKATSSDTPEGGSTERRLDEGGIDRKTYLNQRSYLVDDLTTDKNAKPVKSEYKSAISVPIGEKGVFQAVSKERGNFDYEDLKMAELLASHVSEALDRIQMKEREEFLHSLLRHDVGNKNQIIDGYLRMMRDHDLPDEVEELIEKTERAVMDSTEIIDKVRKLRKIGEEEEVEEIELSSIVDKAFSRHDIHLQDNGINVEMEECCGKVKGGPLLEEMFSNFIENAIRHSDCDKLRFYSKIKEDECIVTVEDDGSGISDDVKDKIFEKGFRSGETAGTGLGLYMVKEIAKSYGGNVEVKDSDLGGARFEVRLKKA